MTAVVDFKRERLMPSFAIYNQRVETTKREMFSQKSVSRFVSDSSAFVMGAMLLASALNRSISPGTSNPFLIFPGGDCLCLGHWLRTWRIDLYNTGSRIQ